jgi:hypothetical protein
MEQAVDIFRNHTRGRPREPQTLFRGDPPSDEELNKKWLNDEIRARQHRQGEKESSVPSRVNQSDKRRGGRQSGSTVETRKPWMIGESTLWYIKKA